MADLNYVSPLTSDLTDYYTKTEVDELQQGDENRFATQAQITAGDNEVKGWVASQGYLTQHQSLANYATKEYVDEAIEDIEVEGGVKIRVVSNLPANPETNVIYLTRRADEEDDNIYNEWIWVADTEDFELIGDTSTGVIPDLTNYATKSYVDTAVAGISVDAKDVAYDNAASGLEAGNVKNAIDEVYAAIPTMPVLAAVATSGDYDDLSNKPTIPSLTGYATTTYVDDAVAAIDIPDVSGFVESSDLATVATSGSYDDLTDKPVIPAAPDLSSYATKSELSAKANAADLATVATSGSYNDLSNKPTIPSTSGLASETYVNNAIAAIDIPDVSDFITAEDLPDLSGYAETANLATVATSGDYDDLSNKPTIPTVPTNVSSFTNDAGYLTSHQDISGKANIADLATVATSGSYNDLTNKPTIPSITGLATETYVDNAVAGISVPANTSDLTNDSGFITSADLPDTSGFVESSDLATVATTGDYDDLTNKPTIPVLPTLATVATSGSYNDLSDKPTIPDAGLTEILGDNFFKLFAFVHNQNISDGLYATPTNQATLIDAYKKSIIFVPDSNLQVNKSSLTSRGYFSSYVYDNGVFNNRDYSSSTIYFYTGMAYVRVGDGTALAWPLDTSQTNKIEKIRNGILKAFTNYQPYSNTTSGLTATTVQAAIDELAASAGSSSGITVQDVIDEFNDNGLTLDNGEDSKIEITNGGISKTGYIGGTEEGVVWSVDKYIDIDETQLLFGKDVVNDDVQTSGMTLTIRPSNDYDAIEVDMSDMANDYNDTKTVAFVEDLPTPEWDYDANTYTLTLSGISQYDDGKL